MDERPTTYNPRLITSVGYRLLVVYFCCRLFGEVIPSYSRWAWVATICGGSMRVKKVKVPALKTLETRPCSPEELQAAIVKLIKLHNRLDAKIDRLISSGQIRSPGEVRMNTSYGL